MKILDTLLGLPVFGLLLFCSPAWASEEDDASEESTDEAPADEAPEAETLPDEVPADEAPVDAAPTDEAPAEEAAVEETPADEAPAKEAPEAEDVADEDSSSAPTLPTVEFTFGAHERARVWIQDSDNWHVQNKADASIGASFGPLYGKVMVRDHRNWGSTGEDGTFEVSEAFAGLKLDVGLDVRWGRMKHNWHNGRLLSDDEWTGGGRSHDGARLGFTREKFDLEALWIKSPAGEKAHVVGLRAGPRIGETLTLDGVAIVDMNLDPGVGQTRATVGAVAMGSVGVLSYQFEGYGQLGDVGDDSYGAWMAAARFAVAMDHVIKPTFGGGVDVLSGDSDPADGKVGTFSTLFGTNHRFLGHADRYLGGNGDAGLIDGQFTFGMSPYEAMRLEVGVHAFAAMEADEGEAFEGIELDLDMTWTPWEPMDILIGVWVFVPRGEDAEVTALVQTDLRF